MVHICNTHSFQAEITWKILCHTLSARRLGISSFWNMDNFVSTLLVWHTDSNTHAQILWSLLTQIPIYVPSGIWSHLPTASLMLTSAPFYISLRITVLASPLVAAGFYITVLASPFVTAGELTDIIYMHIYKWFSWLIKLWYYVISNSSTRVKCGTPPQTMQQY